MSGVWSTLGIPPVRDRDAIRRAYARRLKVTSPEDDAEAFAALRAAYEEAIASLDWDWAWEDETPADTETISATGLEAAIKLDAEVAKAFIQAEEAPTLDASPSRPHIPLLGQLEALLRVEPSPAAGAVETAFDDLLTSPALHEVAIQVDVEMRVLELILDNVPRSDPLVKPAIKTFGWMRSGVISRRDSLVDAVLDRDSDIGFRKGVSAPGVQLHAAYKALSSPLTGAARWQARLSPILEHDVRTLFREIDTRRPSLSADLAPEAYAWWRARLSQPGLPAWMIWPIVGLPLIAALVCGLSPSSAAMTLWIWAGSQAVTVVMAAFYVFGYARPRAWWRATWSWRAPPLLRGGWALAAWGLLLAAPLLPASSWSWLAVAPPAGVILIWALITGEPDRREGTLLWPLRLLVVEMFMIIWWVALSFDTAIQPPPQVLIAATTAILVAMIGSGSLIEIWYGELGDGGRRIAYLVLLAMVAGGVILFIGDVRGSEASLPLATAAWITVLALALRPAATATALESAGVRVRFTLIWPLFIASRHLFEAFDGVSHSLLIGSLWMLVGAIFTLTVTAREIWSSSTADR